MDRIAYVGCRTSRERNARGDGIGVYRTSGAGAWERIQLLDGLVNPAFLAFDRTGDFLYTVHGDQSEISAFAIDKASGRLSFLNRVSSGGRNPVHLSADPSNRFLIVANHVVAGEVRSGIASLAIGADGRLSPPVDVVAFDGKIGPHRVEQPFPKPHQVEFDPSGRFIVVPDKGCDRVMVFALAEGGKLREVPGAAMAARETSGPRHIAFHPAGRLAYLVNELDSTVTACRFDPQSGALRAFQIVSALPDDFTGNSRASEIAVSHDGRHVYASNRGSDTVATFAIDPRSGRLAPLGWTASGGKTPRFFALAPDGDALIVANEDSDTILACDIGSDGKPGKARLVAQTGSPTCILFRTLG